MINRQDSDAEYSTTKMFHVAAAMDYPPAPKNSWTQSRNSVILVTVAVIEAIIVIALQAVIFAQFANHPPADTLSNTYGSGIPVYLIIFIISQFFQVGVSWDAVRAQNTIQVIVFILFNACCFVYSIFQFKQLTDVIQVPALNVLVNRLLIVCAIVIGLCELIYGYLGYRLYQEFGWRIYKKIGADPEIRNMYRWYQILLSILKVDMFFFLAYSIQYLVLVLKMTDYEFALTIVALPLTCVFLIIVVYGVRHESRITIWLFFVGLAAGCAYFSFKIYRMCEPNQQAKFLYVKYFLMFFACVSLCLCVLTIINTAMCYANFGKGLKPHLTRDKTKALTPTQQGDRTLSLD